MEFSVIGEFLDYDEESNIIYIKIDYTSPETQKAIEESVTEKRRTKIKFNHRFRESVKYHQIKCWYGSLRLILISDQYKQQPTSENLEILDEYLRRSIFPVRKASFGKREVPIVSRMKDISREEMDKCIEKLHERYSYLTIRESPIDFSELRGV
jgi:hypothetical protein